MHTLYGNPYKKKDILVIENIQRRATKMIPGLSNFSYEEKLRTLKLLTLKYRRLRGDMIEVFKLLNDMYYYDKSQLPKLREDTTTRGHAKNRFNHRPRLDIRKFSFGQKVVVIWNSLPESIISAKTVLTFEVRLEKYWHIQDILYDLESDIATWPIKNVELMNETETSLLSEEDLW
ncbi:uncharacterized protein LOC128553828 [Mercenaria mercenaria]|uniref:uncharacterized protein LOC128553828 n=1 Tax=Mercenaria mercenaria TaxID=6596 RepID=UPI00234E6373|nr:uncharacterized protein LOC128553828 [Mercenaria mercenaria]